MTATAQDLFPATHQAFLRDQAGFGDEAEDLARVIVELETQYRQVEEMGKAAGDEACKDSDLEKEFKRRPDGMFFRLHKGFVIAYSIRRDDLPSGTEILVPSESEIALDDTYAVVLFGSFFPVGRATRQVSIFRARAFAEVMAAESHRTVSLARAVGRFVDGAIVFQGMELIDFISADEQKQIKPSTTTIQTLIFDRKRFSVSEAKQWAKKHGFRADKVDTPSSGNTIRLRQRAPGEFQAGTFRTITLTSGVQAVVGRPRKKAEEETAKEEEVLVLLEEVEKELTEYYKRLEDDRVPILRKETGVDESILFSREVPIVKQDTVRRVAYGIVYSPNKVDAHGDFMSEDEVLDMAHRFLIAYRHDVTVGVDRNHDEVIRDVDIVESFVVDKDNPDPRFAKDPGAWIAAVKFHDEALWDEVMSGEISGFSMAGIAHHTETGQKTPA